MRLSEEKNQKLCGDHPNEHRERIDCRISNGGLITLNRCIRIVERHGIGHAATEHPDVVSIIQLEETGGDKTHDQDRYDGQQET